jgi:hypothetical protein
MAPRISSTPGEVGQEDGMQKLKIAVEIDRDQAVRQGRSEYGSAVIEIDPAQLAQNERDILAESLRSGSEGVVSLYNYHGLVKIGNVDDPLEAVQIYLRVRASEIFEERARDAKKREDYVEQCADPENWIDDKKIKPPYAYGGITNTVAEGIRSLPESLSARQTAEKIIADCVAEEKRERAERVAEIMTMSLEDLVYQTDSGEWRKNFTADDDEPELAVKLKAAVAEMERRDAEKIECRKIQIDTWVAERGTDNQRGRHALGLLPEDEILDAIRSEAFAPLDEFARYKKLEADDLRHEDCYGTVGFAVDDATEISADQWDMMAKIRALVPSATLTAREHIADCKDCDATETRYSLRVAITMGEFDFTREYAL